MTPWSARIPVLTIALTTALLTGVQPAPAASGGTLTASPGNGAFTAGQELTLRGNLGVRGRHTVRLQSHLGRSGDAWRDVPGATTRTTASGAFTLEVPAHATEITYRMVSGSRRTASWTSQAVQQDVTLRADAAPVAGQPLTLVADTAAMPLLAGRGVTLQQRAGTGWATVTSGALDGAGRSAFVVPVGTETAVYRVRLEDWDSGVGHVGWFPSFPLYVEPVTQQVDPRHPAAGTATFPPLVRAPHQTTAAATGKWGVPLADFDWEHGESLSDKAVLGSRRRGTWSDVSTGTGRVAVLNGALQLTSNSLGETRRGAEGSVSSALLGTSQTTGRWETRIMQQAFHPRPQDSAYVVRAELVPVADLASGCDARAITLYEANARTSAITIGARAAGGASWQRTLTGVAVDNAFHAVAVEVTPKRLTWFLDGQAVGRVTDPAAYSGQPLTLRLSMVAAEDRMTTTRTFADWVRTYPSSTGTPTRGGTRLTAGTHTVTC